jgi:hypothetical protein
MNITHENKTLERIFMKNLEANSTPLLKRRMHFLAAMLVVAFVVHSAIMAPAVVVSQSAAGISPSSTSLTIAKPRLENYSPGHAKGGEQRMKDEKITKPQNWWEYRDAGRLSRAKAAAQGRHPNFLDGF